MFSFFSHFHSTTLSSTSLLQFSDRTDHMALRTNERTSLHNMLEDSIARGARTSSSRSIRRTRPVRLTSTLYCATVVGLFSYTNTIVHNTDANANCDRDSSRLLHTIVRIFCFARYSTHNCPPSNGFQNLEVVFDCNGNPGSLVSRWRLCSVC